MHAEPPHEKAAGCVRVRREPNADNRRRVSIAAQSSAGGVTMSITTSSDQSLITIAQQACNGRTVARIEIDEPDGHLQHGRTRLLACDQRAVYIERPKDQGMPLELTDDAPAKVHFLLDGERYSFRTRVIEECSVQLGDGSNMPGFALELPDIIHRDERRNDYRASLAKCEEVICTIQALDRAGESGFSARVMNISAGGLAAIALELQNNVLERGKPYAVEFSLPGVSQRFHFQTQLRHLRELKGAGYILGLKFLPDTNAAQMRRAVRQVSQFVSKQLKKR